MVSLSGKVKRSSLAAGGRVEAGQLLLVGCMMMEVKHREVVAVGEEVQKVGSFRRLNDKAW